MPLLSQLLVQRVEHRSFLRLRAAVQPDQHGVGRAAPVGRPVQPSGQPQPVLGGEPVRLGAHRRVQRPGRRFGGSQPDRLRVGSDRQRVAQYPRRLGRRLHAEHQRAAVPGERAAHHDLAGHRNRRDGVTVEVPVDVVGDVAQLDLAAALDVPHAGHRAPGRLECEPLQLDPGALGDDGGGLEVPGGDPGQREQRGKVPAGVGVQVDRPVVRAEPAVGDAGRITEQLDVLAGPGVDQQQPARPAPPDPDHRVAAVVAEAAHVGGVAAGELAAAAGAHVDDVRVQDRRVQRVRLGDAEHVATGLPAAEHRRTGGRPGDDPLVGAVRVQRADPGALAAVRCGEQAQPLAVRRPADGPDDVLPGRDGPCAVAGIGQPQLRAAAAVRHVGERLAVRRQRGGRAALGLEPGQLPDLCSTLGQAPVGEAVLGSFHSQPPFLQPHLEQRRLPQLVGPERRPL